MARIFFIHGFGENENIFKHIAPAIGGEQVFINIWKVLGNERQDGINIIDFSKELTNRFNIGKNDVVIGHSMGGWIAYHIKNHIGCKIVQIASWTDFDRIISPITNFKTIAWLTRNHLYINRFQKWIFGMTYNGKPSKEISMEVFEDLIKGNRNCIISQLSLMLTPIEAIDVIPDLRIHAKADTVIRYPKQEFHEVPGDHFTLVTQPEMVIEPILKLLKSSKIIVD